MAQFLMSVAVPGTTPLPPLHVTRAFLRHEFRVARRPASTESAAEEARGSWDLVFARGQDDRAVTKEVLGGTPFVLAAGAMRWVTRMSSNPGNVGVLRWASRRTEYVMRQPRIEQQLSRQGISIVVSTPEALGEYLTAELKKWTAIIRTQLAEG